MINVRCNFHEYSRPTEHTCNHVGARPEETRGDKERKDQNHSHGAGSKTFLDIGISDDWESTVQDGMPDEFADQMLETPIIGVDGDSSVAEHGFKTRGGDLDCFVRF